MVYEVLAKFLPTSMLRRFVVCRHCRSFRSRILVVVVLLNIVFLFSLYKTYNHPAVDITATGFHGIHSDSQKHLFAEPGQKEIANRLQLLDTVEIQRVLKETNIVTDECTNLISMKPKEDLSEKQKWQMVVNGIPETFVFSAFYDARLKPPVIKIIGISSGFYGGPSSPMKYCQLWYREHSSPLLAAAEYTIVPETHNRKYAASFHTCFVRQELKSIPYAVSLVKDKCQLPNNMLKVIDRNVYRNQVDFTVCVTPFNFKYNDVNQLTEFVEVNRMFGAEKFVFYNYSTGSSVDKYLNQYVKEGLASVIPWNIPVAVDVWPPDPKEEPEIHYFGQLAALNDCLYRNMFVSRFIVFSDLDEVIVPRVSSKWSDMLSNVTVVWQASVGVGISGRRAFPGAYLVQNVFFFTNWPDDTEITSEVPAHDHGLTILLKTRREQVPHSWYDRSKYIVWSKMVSMVSVHSVIDFIDDSRVMHIMVPEQDALLHHYRKYFENVVPDVSKSLIDRRMHRFGDELVRKVMAMHKRMNLK